MQFNETESNILINYETTLFQLVVHVHSFEDSHILLRRAASMDVFNLMYVFKSYIYV